MKSHVMRFPSSQQVGLHREMETSYGNPAKYQACSTDDVQKRLAMPASLLRQPGEIKSVQAL